MSVQESQKFDLINTKSIDFRHYESVEISSKIDSNHNEERHISFNYDNYKCF